MMRLIPIYLLYGFTFGLASLEKFRGGGVPKWFTDQFAGTILDLAPHALAIQFYLIATLEASVVLLLLFGLKRRELLLGALYLSAMIFVFLGFGLRLTHDFHGAAESFSYFGVTLISIGFVERKLKTPDENILQY